MIRTAFGATLECAYCRKVWDAGRGEWVYTPGKVTGPVTHGACPLCYKKVLEELDDPDGVEGI